jgi:hypothetical protein
VSELEQGELLTEQRIYPNGQEVCVGDVVDVVLERTIGTNAQPENWLLHPKSPWRKVSHQSPHFCVRGLEEFPDSLWKTAESDERRISESFLAANRLSQSLWIIHPRHTRVIKRCDRVDPKAKIRCSFVYKGIDYSFPVTDTFFTDWFSEKYPRDGIYLGKDAFQNEGNLLFCVSLGTLFHGYHYKLIATIFAGLEERNS